MLRPEGAVMQTPMFGTGEEQAAYKQGITDLLAHQARKKGVDSGPAADIKTIKAIALRIVQDDSIGSRDRMIHLKDAACDLRTDFNSQELKQYLWDARRELAGAAKPVPRGGKLKLAKSRWLWTGVAMAAATTLVIALPKVGKSRLITMMLGRISRGDNAFLGQELSATEPLILIVGPDQTEADWQECLLRAGLSDSEGNLNLCIVGLFHKGCPLHLDESGVDQIVEFCRGFPKLIILLDSYAAATAALGLEEKSSSYADPLIDLQEAIAPYSASLIVIHHSNRHSAKGRASNASRGTTALPAAASQTVSLAWISDPEDNPLAPADYRVKLTTEGRACRPLDLLIEQVDEGFNWISHGSAAEVARTQAMETILDKLTERQSDALRYMTHHWVTTQQGMDRPHLGAALGLDRKRSKEVMDALLQKKLIQFDRERPATGDGRGQPTKLFRPVDAVLPFFPATDLSDISDPVSPPTPEPPSERSEKSDATEERECSECGTTFPGNTRGRPKKYCSRKCKDKAGRLQSRQD